MFQNYVILDSNKTASIPKPADFMFQNYVILDSNKTNTKQYIFSYLFQNYVILDSNKTEKLGSTIVALFQNYVILDSNKTRYNLIRRTYCFRIMLFQIVTKHILLLSFHVRVLELCYFRQ